MNVKLIHATPAWVAIVAIRQCYDSMDKSDSEIYHANGWRGKNTSNDDYNYPTFEIGEKDSALIKKIIQSGHTSTLEHVSVTFRIDGISRAVLQELARHRHASLSVQSSRYTLKKLLNKSVPIDDMFVHTGEYAVDNASKRALMAICEMIEEDNIPNDKLKYAMPESFKTSLILTINMRSLRNLLELRMAKTALWEFRELAQAIYEALPEDHRIFVEDIVEANRD